MRNIPIKATAVISTIGSDIGQDKIPPSASTKRGAIVLQQKVSRSQLARRLANVPRWLVGVEACSGTHHIGRQLEALGHVDIASGCKRTCRGRPRARRE